MNGFVGSRWRPAGWHLLASILIVGGVSVAVVLLWYPPPFATLAGGLKLLQLLVAVDVVLGPLLTAIVAQPRKQIHVFARDLAVILLAQLVAFGFGLSVLASARPIGLVWEVDQFRVVAAADVDPGLLSNAPESLRVLSWTGPRIFAVAKPTNPADRFEAMQLGLVGIELSAQPKYWREYSDFRDAVSKIGVSAETFLRAQPGATYRLGALLHGARIAPDSIRVVPLVSAHGGDWATVVASSDARVIGYLPFEAPRQ